MPAQAKTNREDIPVELSDLKTLEQQLISMRIPFMKIVQWHSLVANNGLSMDGYNMHVPASLKQTPDSMQTI